MYQVRHQNL